MKVSSCRLGQHRMFYVNPRGECEIVAYEVVDDV
jgi:hypothetical protein